MYFQVGAPSYNEVLDGRRTLDTEAGRALTRTLEPARMVGNLATHAIGTSAVRAGLPSLTPGPGGVRTPVTQQDIDAGPLAPLAPKGGGRGADVDSFGGAMPAGRSDRERVENAQEERVHSVGLVFQTARQILREGAPALTKNERQALVQLAERFQQWLLVNFPRPDEVPTQRELRRATRRLENAIRAFMRVLFSA
jgi:hypothetical protein